MRLFLSYDSASAEPELLVEVLSAIRDDAEFLRASYPNFDQWLYGKVLPGVLVGERTLVVETRGAGVAGLLIVKHTEHEKKLCTLRVRPEHESKGLGVRLFEAAFDLLGTQRPLLSVSEPLRPKFSRLFSYFGFSEEGVYQGRYVPRVDEFSYNGLLDAAEEQRGPVLLDANSLLKLGCTLKKTRVVQVSGADATAALLASHLLCPTHPKRNRFLQRKGSALLLA